MSAPYSCPINSRFVNVAAEFIATNTDTAAITPRSRQNFNRPTVLKWAQCQGLQLHVLIAFELCTTRCTCSTLAVKSIS